MEGSIVSGKAMKILAGVVVKNRGELMRNIKLIKYSSQKSASPHEDLHQRVNVGLFAPGSDNENNIE